MVLTGATELMASVGLAGEEDGQESQSKGHQANR